MLSVEQKLARKDRDLHHFLTLVMRAIPYIECAEDRRYVERYFEGLLNGGKTPARVNADMFIGIMDGLFETRRRNADADEACKIVEHWMSEHVPR